MARQPVVILHKAAAEEELVRKACNEMSSWDALVTTVAQLIKANMRLIVEGLFQE